MRVRRWLAKILFAFGLHRNGGDRGQFTRQSGRANAGGMMGSFRTVLLLESGHYSFQARGRTQIEQRAVGAEAVSLRSSEGHEWLAS